MAIKILIGGSPCTYWSIAQKNNRETEASGMGWELFKNYLIAKEKFKPDLFLYENNKSASQAIKDQIAKELGVGVDPDVRFTYINSALVSAQNRQRFYVTNFGDIEQPADRGILLKDILETGTIDKDKAYCLKHQAGNIRDYFKKHHTQVAFEPVGTTKDGKAYCLTSGYSNGSGEKIGNYAAHTLEKGCKSMVAEPVGYASLIEQPHQRKKDQNGKYDRRFEARTDNKANALVSSHRLQFGMITEPVRVGCMPSPDGTIKNGQAMRVYDVDGKSVNLTAQGGGLGAKTGLYAVPVNTTVEGKSYALTSSYYKCGENPCSEFGEEKRRPRVAEPVEFDPQTVQNAIPQIVEKYGYIPEMFNAYNRSEITDKSPTLSTGSMVTSSCATNRFESICGYATPCEWDENGKPTKAISCADEKVYTVYEVKDGQITIKGKQYPIKLSDGYYIIRKLTVRECARLQTMPDDYCKAVSDSQAYKALGNGWTAEVIIWLLNHALKDVPRDEEIIVLSMYDGIATGRYCLDKMGFTDVTYHAYEIDKYPIMVAMDNYPDIIQHGDAFAVCEDDWSL